MKPGNFGVEKPGLSGLPRVSGLFPGVSEVHSANPKSHSRTYLPWIISNFHIFLLIQMVRVNVCHKTLEPSTQRRTKARHDPAALTAVQEELGQGGS
jgi:hypothetical protein